MQEIFLCFSRVSIRVASWSENIFELPKKNQNSSAVRAKFLSCMMFSTQIFSRILGRKPKNAEHAPFMDYA